MSSSGLEANATDQQSQEVNEMAQRRCVLCSKPVVSDLFTPYCSLKCAREGVRRRYSLLSTFIDFESKYINPPKKGTVAPKSVQALDDASGAVEEKPKKLKR